MKVLFVGDVVGPVGRRMVDGYLKRLKNKYKPQVTIVNGENASDRGRGIDEKIFKYFMQAGADVVTLGNHAFDHPESLAFIGRYDNLLRPANYPSPQTPGRGLTLIKVNQVQLAIINVQGNALMQALDDPFQIMDRLLKELEGVTPNIFVDFHAETTSEKQALAHYLDGRVSAVIGTHTHVQTNDCRILSQGTAYMTDVGMTGPEDSIIGMRVDDVLQRYLTKLPTKFKVQDQGRGFLNACLIDINDLNGKAISIQPIVVSDRDSHF